MAPASIEAALERIHPLCVMGGGVFYAIMEPRLRFFLEWLVPQAINRYFKVRKFLARRKIYAVFAATSVCTNVLQGITTQAVRDQGAVFNVYQHGSFQIFNT